MGHTTSPHFQQHLTIEFIPVVVISLHLPALSVAHILFLHLPGGQGGREVKNEEKITKRIKGRDRNVMSSMHPTAGLHERS